MQMGALNLGPRGLKPLEIVGFDEYYVSEFFSGEVAIDSFHQILKYQ